jgi:hypothetical protein
MLDAIAVNSLSYCPGMCVEEVRSNWAYIIRKID